MWCIFLFENLTLPGRNYNTKMEVTPLRNCYCLNECNSSTDLWSRKPHVFALGPEAGKHQHLIPILKWEDSFNLDHTSTGSLYKYIEFFTLFLHVLAFLGHQFLYWHWNIFLWDSSIYWRLAEISSCVDWTTTGLLDSWTSHW